MIRQQAMKDKLKQRASLYHEEWLAVHPNLLELSYIVENLLRNHMLRDDIEWQMNVIMRLRPVKVKRIRMHRVMREGVCLPDRTFRHVDEIAGFYMVRLVINDIDSFASGDKSKIVKINFSSLNGPIREASAIKE